MLSNAWKSRRLSTMIRNMKLLSVPKDFSYEVKNVGVLLEFHDSDQMELVAKKIEYYGISRENIQFLIQDKNSSKQQEQEFNYFNLKAFNNTGRCIKQQVVDFINKPFDVLISLYNKEFIPLQWVTASSKAKCKVGMLYTSQSLNHFDIKLDQVKGEEFVELFFSYLTVFRNNEKNQKPITK